MRPFAYASRRCRRRPPRRRRRDRGPPTVPAAQYLAGGTTLLDLMKLDVMRPERLVDINGPRAASSRPIERGRRRACASARWRGWREVADHPRRAARLSGDRRSRCSWRPARRSATWRRLGGNVLQRTRCTYFRDASWARLQQARAGLAAAPRWTASTASTRCSAPASTASPAIPAISPRRWWRSSATVEIAGPGGAPRASRSRSCTALPGDTPHIETTLTPGELITGFLVPAGRWTRRSLYLKIRDRAILRIRAGVRGGRARPRRRRGARGAHRARRRRHRAVARARGRERRSPASALDEAERRRGRRGRLRRARGRRATTTTSSSSASARWSAPCCRPRDGDLTMAWTPARASHRHRRSVASTAALKVTGEARYGSDTPVANPAYAFLVTSAIARGRIAAIDETRRAPCPACSTS